MSSRPDPIAGPGGAADGTARARGAEGGRRAPAHRARPTTGRGATRRPWGRGTTRRRSGRGATRWLPRALVALVLIAVVGAGWLTWRGVQVADASRTAVPELRAVQAALATGDTAAVRAHRASLDAAVGDAAAATSDPVWRLASGLPWLGPQLDAVTDLVTALEAVASDVMPPLTQAGQALSPAALTPVDGRVDLAPLRDAAPHLTEAASAAGTAHDMVDGIGRQGLVRPLAGAVDDADALLAQMHEAVDVAAVLARLLPGMLGGDEPRRYLLLALNAAELRGGGGIVGAVAVLSADDGSVTLEDHLTARDFGRRDVPVLPLTAGELRVHSELLGRHVQNVTMTPDFPRTAELVVQMWQERRGTPVDGVLALDPVALAYILAATGPITAPDGTVLDADGAVELLLSDVYARMEPLETDLFFADAAAAVFGALADGRGSNPGLAPAVGRAVQERRLAVWSAHDDEQDELAGTAVGGGFLSGAADGAAGVFLDDATGSKLGYYIGADVEVTAPCDGHAARLRVALRSDVPKDASALPPYVLGPMADELGAGTVRHNVSLYAPVGGQVVAVRQGEAVVGGLEAEYAGREVVVLTADLAPGETVTYDVELRVPDKGPLVTWYTPGVTGTGRSEGTCG